MTAGANRHGAVDSAGRVLRANADVAIVAPRMPAHAGAFATTYLRS
jgi:hypothetical protein